MPDARFYDNRGPLSLTAIEELVGARAEAGDGDGIVTDVADLPTATTGHLAYCASPRYTDALSHSKASVILVTDQLRPAVPRGATSIVVNDPVVAFACISAALYPDSSLQWPRDHPPTLDIDPTAKIGAGTVIAAGASIGFGAEIGRDCTIGQYAVIGRGVVVGDHATIAPHVRLSHSVIGHNVIIHGGTGIGQDGFRFVGTPTGIVKIPQLGRVIIDDDVEIGANVTIDRGALGDTRIGRGTKIDNLVQIAHNVQIGRFCIIVAQAGIAGSTTLGDGVIIGGMTGLIEHLTVANGVKVAAGSAVTCSLLEPNATYQGDPAEAISTWRRGRVALRKLLRDALAHERKTQAPADFVGKPVISKIMSSFLGMLLCVAVATPATAQRQPNGTGTAEIVARPVRLEGADVEYVQMRMQLTRDANASSVPLSLAAPIVSGGIFGLAERLENVEMADATGPVPVRIEDDKPISGGPPGSRGLGDRHWRAGRPVAFPVTITYRARIWPPGTRSNPTYMLRAVEGSVSGRGYGFLLTPEDSVNYAAHFRWDMSDLPGGSTTASGLTDENDIRTPLSTLMNTYMMAGRLHRYPAQGDQGGFIGYWVGSPAWDPMRVMEWTAQMYVYMRAFHGDTGRRVYRVMGRMYAPPAYGGSALENHFVFNAPAAPRDTADKGPLVLLTHEMGHSYVRGLQNPGGGGGSNNWFSEGLNEFYAVTLALRSGLGAPDLVLGTINMQTRAYYTNPRRNMPADSVARIGLNDVNVQNVSYQRGLLFWADMDAQIRAATKGRRNLDSVVVPMMHRARAQAAQAAVRRAQGERGVQVGGFTPDELVAALAKEIGPAARKEFDAVIIRGETLVPATNAFGPCFELRPAKLPKTTGSGSSFDTGSAPRPALAPSDGIDGYLWYRVPDVSDERCRTW